MTNLEKLLQPLLQSPLVPLVYERLGAAMEAERARRERFYREMTPEQKVEFIGGEVVMHSPARNKHLDVTLRISTLLSAYTKVRDLGEVKVEKCLCVFPRNDYEPDVVFFTKAKSSLLSADTLKFPVPDLAVEVLSHSTQQRDRGVKFEDFAANGVGEYWIVDTDESVIEQYRLVGGEYELVIKSTSGRLSSQIVDAFVVEIEAFFDDTKYLETLRHLLDQGSP